VRSFWCTLRLTFHSSGRGSASCLGGATYDRPVSMRAATIVNGNLEVREHPEPVAGTGEVLIVVRAAGLNNADLLQIAGFYPAPPGSPSDIPGLELAGEVVAVGPGATRFAIGDRVMAVVGGGALAERAVVHERTLLPVPAATSWETAGGFPEAFTTAHDALFTQCGLQMGERVCVHGAAGGVGVAAVQLAAAAGASVVATVRDPARRAAVEALAPGSIIAVAPDGFGVHGPFDVVLELVGASNLEANLAALSIGGRISIIGVGGGGSKTQIDLLTIMSKRARLMGSTLRARPLEQKADAARRVEAQVLPHLASGRHQVPVTATFPLDQVNAAYDRFREGAKFGKIIVRPG
jgi:NADPH:quinone reductase